MLRETIAKILDDYMEFHDYNLQIADQILYALASQDGLTENEVDAIKIDAEEMKDIEETCAIGLTDCEEDHLEYGKRLPYLIEQRLKLKTSKLQSAILSAKYEAEIATLKEQIADYNAQSTLTYCVYCGATFRVDDKAGTHVTEHIQTCEKHPLFQARAEIADLKKLIEKLKEDKR